MTAAIRSIYLDSYLAPFAPHLARTDVTDIFVNRPGEVWVQPLSGGAECHAMPELTRNFLLRLSRQIAAVSSQAISREHPLLAASLPTGERIQIVLPPATRGEVVMAIRKHVVSSLALEDYAQRGAFTRTAVYARAEAGTCRPPLDPSADPVSLLRTAVRERRNILVSGGTASGKTTFVNSLLREIPDDERLVIIEDTPELQFVHENAVGLIGARGTTGEAEVTAEDLLIASLRLRPDRIILGEIRGKEAMTFLRAVNTGHPGSLSTIHADSPERAIDQLALLVLQTGTRMDWESVVQYVRRSVDVVVQLNWAAGVRVIEEIRLRDE